MGGTFRQHGGYIPRPELAIVGEAGPELVALPGGSRVYPNSSLGSTVIITVNNINPQYSSRADQDQFLARQRDQIKAVVAQAMSSDARFREAMA